MDRADQKKIINMAFVERQNQPPINLNKETIQMPIKDIIWHHVTLSGEFLNDKNIILDNRIREEKAGFLIYTPFKILNSNKINCADFSKGLYFIKLEGSTKLFKVIKEK